MRRIRILLFSTVIIALSLGYFLQPGKKIDEKKYLGEIAPDINFSEKKGSPAHYLSDSGVVAFNTYDVTPSITGYAGPIKLLLSISDKGVITGIKILEHKETKNYVHYMERPEYLGRFLGKSIKDKFEIDRDVDGISRATVSVEALAKTIRESSRITASNVYGMDVSSEGAGRFEVKWISYLLIFSFSLVFYFLTRRSKRLLRARDWGLAAGILITGIYLSSPFSILHVFNLILLRPSSSILWLVIICTTFISLIVAGRLYCGWLCPFGAISEFIGRLPVRKWSVPVETDDRWRNLKYILLAVIIAIVLLSRRPDYGNYETYVTLFSFHGNYLTWLLVAITLIANLKIERFWCRYLCPVAAFTGILSRKAKGYPSRHDCPMGNKPMPMISECIRCNRCYKGRG
ncbi:MAG: 4Fe-4S binding protein [Nitrospirae bacterium]|nr:MAG: 4Fe-4S binding protein [Nitrospirota bacterium]